MNRPLHLISLVLPVYNEEEVLPLLLPRITGLLERLPCEAEVIFVNDGSSDRSAQLLAVAAEANPRLKVVDFSRNFGHQMAISAGVDFAGGDVVIVMDSDLQDPPELVLEMIGKYAEGYDVVYAQRTQRHGETWFKRLTAAGFYWLMRTMIHKDLPQNTGDFRLMSRQVVHALRQLREQHRFVRGMVTWLGFRQTSLPFERPQRAAGQTKYPLHTMLAFAWRAISSFSGLPLRLAFGVGAMMMLGAFIYAVVSAYLAVVSGVTAPGWASLVCLQVGLSGITLLVLGLTGDYIARIYEEIKGRPLYIVRETRNLSRERLIPIPARVALSMPLDDAEDAPQTTPLSSPHIVVTKQLRQNVLSR